MFDPLTRRQWIKTALVTVAGAAGLAKAAYAAEAPAATVKKAGYRGPVGFQGYGIKGNSEEILSRTMKKWREIMAKISA